MHGSLESGLKLAGDVQRHVTQGRLGMPAVVLCPPAVLLPILQSRLPNGLSWGGQDCHAEAEGAFTGDISARMLKEAGCTYVLVGHSERRVYHRETDQAVRKKAVASIAAGLVPIICVGENADQRESGAADTVIAGQIEQCLSGDFAPAQFVLAYEPVWAIGTGKVATLDDIERMHSHIKNTASARLNVAPDALTVLYGGSVKPSNARDILLCPAVDGVLVGGASLQAHDFNAIIDAAIP